MITTSRRRLSLAELEARIETATHMSMALFAELLSTDRLMQLAHMGKTRHLDRLVGCEAWTDAALELVALAAPQWTVQRLCRTDGEWLCSLTRFPDMPEWLDDVAEATHVSPSLAILAALVRASILEQGQVRAMPAVGEARAPHRFA